MQARKPEIYRTLKVLSPSQIRDIHRATLAILEKVGAVFEEEEALELLGKAGAQITNEVVRLPSEMVERLLKQCPPRVTLHATNPQQDVLLGAGRVHYTNGYGTTFVKDLETGEIREARLEDLENFTRLADYLDNVAYVLNQVIPQDVPSELADVYQALVLLKNTNKHVGLSVTKSTYLDQVIEIGKLASGRDGRRKGKPSFVFSLGTTSVSPLRFSRDGTTRLLKLSRAGVATRVVSGATGGATSPVSLAGTLALQNAEILAGICLAQTVNPGNPVLYGTFAAPMDMVRGKQAMGAPEAAILSAATAQLCRFYRLPFGYGTGGVTDSAAPDIQAGIEKAYTLLYTALSRVDVIHDGVGGLLGSAMVSSYEQMMIDDEICNMVNRGLAGIRLDDESLALDLIAEVSHFGNYLTTDHTLRHFREELFLPSLFDRRSPGERKEGELQIFERARSKAREILATHRPRPLVPEIEEKMDQVLTKVLKAYEKGGSVENRELK